MDTLTRSEGGKDVNLLGLTPEQIQGVVTGDIARDRNLLLQKRYEDLARPAAPKGYAPQLKVGRDGFYYSIEPSTGRHIRTEVKAPEEKGFPPNVGVDAQGRFVIIGKDGTTSKTEVVSHASTKEDRQMLKNAGDATARIEDGLRDQGLSGDVQIVNNSKVPYMYIWGKIPGIVYGTNPGWQKIDLPMYRGKQITAKDIHDTPGNPEDVLRRLGVQID